TEVTKTERARLVEYAAPVAELLGGLTPANHALAVEIASVPETIRGYGHVKLRHLKLAQKQRAELLAKFSAPAERSARAA
ncbi:MAG: hypothetical protein Q8K27_02960, partial [Betaproteobacteria bacterium]|nr:hypothetical protein [Betaproteobacteria bacterium]